MPYLGPNQGGTEILFGGESKGGHIQEQSTSGLPTFPVEEVYTGRKQNGRGGLPKFCPSKMGQEVRKRGEVAGKRLNLLNPQ